MDEYQKTPYLKLDPNELNTLETGSNQVITAKLDKLETQCQVTVITSPKEIIL